MQKAELFIAERQASPSYVHITPVESVNVPTEELLQQANQFIEANLMDRTVEETR